MSSALKSVHEFGVGLQRQGVNNVEEHFSELADKLKEVENILVQLEQAKKSLQTIKCPKCGTSINLEIK